MVLSSINATEIAPRRNCLSLSENRSESAWGSDCDRWGVSSGGMAAALLSGGGEGREVASSGTCGKWDDPFSFPCASFQNWVPREEEGWCVRRALQPPRELCGGETQRSAMREAAHWPPPPALLLLLRAALRRVPGRGR